MSAGWWILLAVFVIFGGFRGIIAWAMLVFVFAMLGGCATVDPDQAEYDRVEWVETQFKPAVRACEASGGILVYNGPSDQRMRRILAKSDWDRVHRTDWTYFACAKRS